MRSVTHIVLFGMLVILASCLPEPLSVDGIPQLKPKIVVSSQIDDDQTLLILLTKSVGALEANDNSNAEELLNLIAINDAVVTVRTRDFSETLTPLGNGVYISVTIPLEAGVEYFLEVESPSMGTVTASTFVESPVKFDFLEASIYYTGFDTLVEVSYGFDDLVGENFYMFNLQRLTNDFEPEDLLNPQIFTQLVDDKGFEGDSYFDRKRVFANRDFVPGDTVGIFLSNISEQYYDFMQIRLDSRFSFADFLGEPANYPSNIKGGLGFFNLYIPDVRILEIQ